MTGACRIDTWLAHEPEDCVACPQRHGDASFSHEPCANETAGVITRPRDHLRGRKPVTHLPIPRQRSNDGRRGRNCRELVTQSWCCRCDGGRPPVLRREIHQVHARGVAGVDGCVGTHQQRGEKRADQVHPPRLAVSLWRSFEEPTDLRTGEPLKGAGARAPREQVCSANACRDLRALFSGAGVHPDR